MDQATKFDPRRAPLTLHVKSMATPQALFSEKAGTVRAEKSNGVWNLYRHDDIIKINRHPAILGNGGQGGSFGNDNPLIPLEIDGEDHKKWRKLLDPIFGPKQMFPLEAQIRQLAGELIDKFASRGEAELSDEFCVPLPSLTFLRLVGAPVEDLDFFLDFKQGVIHPEGDTVEEMDANMAAAGGKLLEYFVKFLAERRAETEQKDDIIAVLLRSEVDGEPIAELVMKALEKDPDRRYQTAKEMADDLRRYVNHFAIAAAKRISLLCKPPRWTKSGLIRSLFVYCEEQI